MRAWQIQLVAEGAFPTEARVRAAVRALARALGPEGALFSITDDRVHAVIFSERPVAALRARALCRVLRGGAAAPLGSARVAPVASREDLERLLRELLGAHGALGSGSCFADLVGARVLPGFAPRLTRALPRFSPGQACDAVGLLAEDLRPLSLDAVHDLGPARVLAAAAAALAVDPALPGRAAPVLCARALAARLSAAARIPRADLGCALGRSRRHVFRMAAAPVPPAWLTCARVRLAIEEAVGRS